MLYKLTLLAIIHINIKYKGWSITVINTGLYNILYNMVYKITLLAIIHIVNMKLGRRELWSVMMSDDQQLLTF